MLHESALHWQIQHTKLLLMFLMCIPSSVCAPRHHRRCRGPAICQTFPVHGTWEHVLILCLCCAGILGFQMEQGFWITHSTPKFPNSPSFYESYTGTVPPSCLSPLYDMSCCENGITNAHCLIDIVELLALEFVRIYGAR